MFRIKSKMEKDQPGKEELRCSFCDKAQLDVCRLIAGPDVYICDECVRLCLDIMEQDRPVTEMSGEGTSPTGALPVSCSLCGMLTPPDDAMLVENRGALCPLCVQEVQAAIAERDERHPQS